MPVGESGFGFFFTCSGVTGNVVYNLSLYTAAIPSADLEYLGMHIYERISLSPWAKSTLTTLELFIYDQRLIKRRKL